MVHLPTPGPDTGHFSTHEVRPRDKPTTKTSRIIRFPLNHYTTPPNLAAGFTALDLSSSNERPLRANLVGSKITTESFKVMLESWKDEHGEGLMYGGSCCWIERKGDAKGCVFGQFDTRDVRKTVKAKEQQQQQEQEPGPGLSRTSSALKGAGRTRTQPATTTSPAKARRNPQQPDTATDAIPEAPPQQSPEEANSHDPHPQENSTFIPLPPNQFTHPPTIIPWLNRLDLSSTNDRNHRIRSSISGIRPDGFTAHLDTWGDSLLHGAGMAWIAFPAHKRGVDAGTFATADVRLWHEPRAVTRGRVRFREGFVRGLKAGGGMGRPVVLAALSMLDCAGNADLRVEVVVREEEVDEEGFWWEVRSEGESTCYAAACGWIALAF